MMFRTTAPHQHGPRLIPMVALLVIVGGFLSYIGGLFWFVAQIPRLETPLREMTPSVTPTRRAIVVLTGGSGRLETGLALLRRQNASALFISGVHDPNVLNLHLQNLETQSADHASGAIIKTDIDTGNALNTYENAIETAQWLKDNNIMEFYLVTAAYHMPRSLLELDSQLRFLFGDAPPRQIAVPVYPDHVIDPWWRGSGTSMLIIKEYTKYLLSWTRLRTVSLYHTAVLG